MVLFSYTPLADAAMFTSRGLEKMTCMADLAGLEQHMIIGVKTHMLVVVVGGDVGGCGRDTAIYEVVGNSAQA